MNQSDLKNVWPGWELAGLLGRGSYGEVYRIQRDVFGETEHAALKVITVPQSSDEVEELRGQGYDDASITGHFKSYLKDIIREYSLMSKLKGCANIVYCDDVKYIQHDDGFGWDIFIKMELLTPLLKTLGQTNASDRMVKDLARDMCRALEECEKQNILHRDIKPQNIFVARDGTYKLGDFGVAKAAERTAGGTKAGTYKYMAPEIYNNQPYGAKADQYSLGMVLYLLMNRRRTPFLPSPPQIPTAQQEEEARARRFRGEVIPPPADGSPALQRIVLRMLSFDPQQRYPNAAAILRDLEALGAVRSESPVISEEPEEPVAEKPAAFGAVSTASPAFLPDDGATMGAFSSSDPRRQAAPSLRPAPVPKDPESPPPPPPKEEVIRQSKSRRGLIFGLCGAVALGLILLLILLPGRKGSPSAAPAGTEPPVVMETLTPEQTPEPTSESTPETTPEPTPEPIAEPPEEPVQSPEELLAQGYTQMNDSTFWKLEDGTLSIAGTGAMPDFDSGNHTPWYDDRGQISSVVIHNGVTSIGNEAFRNCSSLHSVTLADSVAGIGNWSFSSCSKLTSVALPANLASLGEYAFSSCFSLEAIALPDAVSIIPSNAFSQCSALTAVKLPKNLTFIGDWAFESCYSLSSLSLPEGLASIDSRAFYSCSALRTVTVPKSLKYVKSGVFFGCRSLSEVYYAGSEQDWNGIQFNADNDPIIIAKRFYNSTSPADASAQQADESPDQGFTPLNDQLSWRLENGGVLTIRGEGPMPDFSWGTDQPWYKDRNVITAVVIREGVTTVGAFAFLDCDNLSSLTLPGSLTGIGQYAFFSCSLLPPISIPDGVTTIGQYAFSGCYNLTSVTIPASVTSIGSSAFSDCDKLGSFTVAEGNKAYTTKDGVLFSKDMKTLAAYPAGKKDAEYSVPAGVTVIANYAFYSCDYLKSVTLPAGVTEIGSSAFGFCENMASITLSPDLARIGEQAFWTCRKLSSLKIPVSVVSIGEKAFGGLTELKEIRYAGTEAQWKAISFGKEWYGTTSPTIVYNAS